MNEHAKFLREESDAAMADDCPVASNGLKRAADEIKRLTALCERLRDQVIAEGRIVHRLNAELANVKQDTPEAYQWLCKMNALQERVEALENEIEYGNKTNDTLEVERIRLTERVEALEVTNAKLSNYMQRVEDAVKSYQATEQEGET